jgi:hypothetical protein
MGEPQDGKERRLWNPEATTAIEFTQTRLRRPRPTRMSRHLLRRFGAPSIAQIEKLIGELHEARNLLESESEFSERLLAI